MYQSIDIFSIMHRNEYSILYNPIKNERMGILYNFRSCKTFQVIVYYRRTE